MKTGCLLGMALLCLLVSPAAPAQTAVPIVAVCAGDCSRFTDQGITVFDTIDAAVADAKSKATSSGTHYTVLVSAGTWTTGAGIVIGPADDIEIVGEPDKPEDAIITLANPSTDVIELNGASSAFVIEGVTITGGDDGVWTHTASAGTIARCYIHGNKNGIRAETGAATLIVNCSLTDNSVDGVNVAGATTDLNVLYCSIFLNAEHGVYVNGAKATVQDSLIYQNGLTGALADRGGLVVVAGGTATADYNNATGNYNAQDYVGVTATNDPAVADPGFATPITWGKITSSSGLIGQGSIVSITGAERFTSVDYEGDQRPSPLDPPNNVADIGADEFSTAGATGTWYYCSVQPAFITPSVIPKSAPGDLLVDIRISGGAAFNPGDIIGLIVPQGRSYALETSGAAETPHIPLRVRTRAGNGFYYCTNLNEIDTILGTDFTPTGPSAGDVIADGHGVIHIRQGGIELPATGQALNGRHVLIDTVAPQMQVSATGTSAYWFFDLGNAGSYGATGLSLPDGGHVGLPGLPGTWRPNSATLVTPKSFSFDDGLIMPTPSGGQGAQAFFNVGSLSNGYAAENLDAQPGVTFVDPPVTDGNGNAVGGIDYGTDYGQADVDRPRQPAGFDETAPPPDEVPTAAKPIRWTLAAGSDSLPTNIVADPTQTFGSTAYQAGGYFPARKDQLAARWQFRNKSDTTLGLPYSGGRLHLAIQFAAFDLSGNITPPEKVLDPLHLWWILDTRTRIQPNREGTQVDIPDFAWSLDRGFDPRTAGQPDPVFTYRLWWSNTYDGSYSPFTSWLPWSTQTRLTPPQFNALGIDSFVGKYIMLTVVGADEAGNVEKWQNWTNGGIVDDTSDIIDFSNPLKPLPASGANWQRFLYKGAGSDLDTTVTPFFWHNNLPPDAQQGPGEATVTSFPLVPSPKDLSTQRLEVRFEIRPVGATHPKIQWELVRESQEATKITGAFVYPPSVSPLSSIYVFLPYDMNSAPPYLHLGDSNPDPAARPPVNYVFRAVVLDDKNNDGTYELIDATPANVSFTVVSSVSEFIQNKNSADLQPIKTQEEK